MKSRAIPGIEEKRLVWTPYAILCGISMEINRFKMCSFIGNTQFHHNIDKKTLMALDCGAMIKIQLLS